MKKIRRGFFLACLIGVAPLFSFAQTAKIGGWTSYLSLSHAVDLIKRGDKIYVGTGKIETDSKSANGGGVFSYDISTGEVKTFSTVEGLNNIDVSSMELDNKNGIIIGYTDGNIDVLDENNIVRNIGDIKRSQLFTDKKINGSVTKNDSIFFATNFGIVVYDNTKQEVRDNYTSIASNGSGKPMYGVAYLDSGLFAATDNGVAFGYLNSTTNLRDPNSWKFFTLANDSLPQSVCQQIAFFNGTIYAIVQKQLYAFTLVSTNNYKWRLIPSFPNASSINTIRKMRVYNNSLTVAFEDTGFVRYTWTLFTDGTIKNVIHNVWGYAGDPQAAFVDENGKLWVADNGFGISGHDFSNYFVNVNPNRPASNYFSDLDMLNEELWGTSIGWDGALVPTWISDLFYQYKDGVWKNFYSGIGNPENIAVDVKTNSVYIGTIGNGLIKVQDGQIVKVYNNTNSCLDNHSASTPDDIRVGGGAVDENGIVWVACLAADSPLVSIDPSGNCMSYIFGSSPWWLDITIDDYNQKWIVWFRGGIALINADNTQMLNLTDEPNTGGLASIYVNCITKDKNGEIWIGTQEGISVFYDPSIMFSNQNFDAQCPFYNQRCLLKDQVVRSIAVDGGNRKWIGTDNGVWLFSDEGDEAIAYYSTDNSPLVSNSIVDIAIHPKTGEVFIATAKGLMSMMGTATEGTGGKSSDILVYPNPFYTDQNNIIAIRGTVTDSEVKIVDINGNLVQEMKTEGGMAIWDGRDKWGQKVHSGVYTALIYKSKGNVKSAAKILIINNGNE